MKQIEYAGGISGTDNHAKVVTHCNEDQTAERAIIPSTMRVTGSDLGREFQITVPTPLQSLPERFGLVGGRYFQHPTHRELVSKSEPRTREFAHYGLGIVEAVTPRNAVTFHNRMNQTFSAYSFKAGDIVTGTGPHEFAVFKELEIDPDKTAIAIQAIRYQWENGISYTPDFVAVSAAQGIMAGEIKASQSYFWPPEVCEVMVNAERTSRSVGVTFLRICGADLHRDLTRRRNVDSIYQDRFTDFTLRHVELIHDTLAATAETPLAKVHEILAPWCPNPGAVTNAMMCKRHLAYDFGSTLTPDTIVRAAPAAKKSPDLKTLRLAEPASNDKQPNVHAEAVLA